MSDFEPDPDKRLERYPLTMAPITGRSHVPTLTDKPELRRYATGLPPADTYLGLMRGGSLVPRLINETPNTKARRKKMRDVESRFGRRSEEEAPRDVEMLRDEVRPHVESVLFGSSIRPSPEDREATQGARDARAKIKREMARSGDISAAGVLAHPPVERGLTGTRGTDTHAEQSMLDTRAWTALINALTGAITNFKDQPETIDESTTSIELVLNRSTCIGCAQALTLELIRFWQFVAEATGLKDWREAKFAYEDYVRFTVAFPSIYEIAQEKKKDFRNLQRIVAGLQDAGWEVRMFTGISGGEKSDETNAEAKKQIEQYTSIPTYYSDGWSQDVVRFPIPDVLKAPVARSGAVIINGLLYEKVEGADALSRDPDAAEDSIDAVAVAAHTFHPTGRNAEATPDDEGHDEEGPRSKLGKIAGNAVDDENDPERERLLNEGYEFQDVSGSGMNCLIRALFRAAGVAFDEAMVAIVRRHLVEQGVAVNGDMLDLLDEQGATLVSFLQQQGLLGADTGITVHFPGGWMEVLAGGNQLHLWYADAHFQAVLPP